MKQKLLLLLVTLLMFVTSFAQVEAPLAPGDYLIVNAEGGYIGGGNNWGTQATLLGKPQWFTLTLQDGKYTLDSHQSTSVDSHYLDNIVYCDRNAYEWTIEALDEENTLFTIATNDGKYLSVGDGMNKPLTLVNEYEGMEQIWCFKSMDKMLDEMSEATDEEPVDVTWIIKDSELKRGGNFEGNWTITSFDGTAGVQNFSEGNNNNIANCAESWRSTNGFKAVQTITLPMEGIYTLTAQAFYKKLGEDDHTPYLFAGEKKSEFFEITGTENNMVAAYASFLEGKYPVTPITILAKEAGDTIEIGYAGENTTYWNVFGELTLNYMGKIKPGDADLNNTINVNDYNTVKNYILTPSTIPTDKESFAYLNADANEDEAIDASDCEKIIELIFEDAANRAPRRINNEQPLARRSQLIINNVEGFCATANGNQLVISADNATAFLACQMDLGINAADIKSIITDANHRVSYSTLKNGKVRVLVTSYTNETFNSNELLNITLNSNATASIENAIFTNTVFQSVKAETSETTAISHLSTLNSKLKNGKFVENNHIVIVKEGEKFNTIGQQIK